MMLMLGKLMESLEQFRINKTFQELAKGSLLKDSIGSLLTIRLNP